MSIDISGLETYPFEYNGSFVKLNVGGTRFLTTETTLSSKGGNFFTALIEKIKEGKMKPVIDDEGYIFIDRNGRIFEIVLEYLRTGLFLSTPGVSKEQALLEFEYYSIEGSRSLVETEAFMLAHHEKWESLASMFFDRFWSRINAKLQEIVVEHGLNTSTITLVHGSLTREHEEVQRFYNNIRVLLDEATFAIPLKPLFLDNIIYLLRDLGFETSYISRQQTVDFNISWFLDTSKTTPCPTNDSY